MKKIILSLKFLNEKVTLNPHPPLSFYCYKLIKLPLEDKTSLFTRSACLSKIPENNPYKPC